MPTVKCHDCNEILQLSTAIIMRRGYTCDPCSKKPKQIVDCRFCIDKHDPKDQCDWGAVRIKILRLNDSIKDLNEVVADGSDEIVENWVEINKLKERNKELEDKIEKLIDLDMLHSEEILKNDRLNSALDLAKHYVKIWCECGKEDEDCMAMGGILRTEKGKK